MTNTSRSTNAKLTVRHHEPLGFFTRGEGSRQLLTVAIESDHGHPCMLMNTDPEGRSGPFADPYTSEAYDLEDLASALVSYPDGMPFRCKEDHRVCGHLVSVDLDHSTVEIVPEPDLDTRTW